MNIQQLRLSAGPKIALHTHFVPFSSQNQINKISQIVFDKFPLTLLCLPIMASCTEGGCKIYLISTLIHGTMHITQCNALNNNVLLQMDIFPNSSMNKICLNHITRVTKSASFSTSSTFRFAAYRSAIFKFVMTFRLLSVGQMWSFFGNTWSAIGDLKQNLTPFSGAPHLIWTKKTFVFVGWRCWDITELVPSNENQWEPVSAIWENMKRDCEAIWEIVKSQFFCLWHF